MVNLRAQAAVSKMPRSGIGGEKVVEV